MTVAVLETAGRYQTELTGCAGRLKDYVLANMMWDPTQDPDALISEFLIGYYSELGAPFVRKYMDTMHAAVSLSPCRFYCPLHTVAFCCLGDARGNLRSALAFNRLELSQRACRLVVCAGRRDKLLPELVLHRRAGGHKQGLPPPALAHHQQP